MNWYIVGYIVVALVVCGFLAVLDSTSKKPSKPFVWCAAALWPVMALLWLGVIFAVWCGIEVKASDDK